MLKLIPYEQIFSPMIALSPVNSFIKEIEPLPTKVGVINFLNLLKLKYNAYIDLTHQSQSNVSVIEMSVVANTCGFCVKKNFFF